VPVCCVFLVAILGVTCSINFNCCCFERHLTCEECRKCTDKSDSVKYYCIFYTYKSVIGAKTIYVPHVDPVAVSKWVSVLRQIYEAPKPEQVLSISRPEVIGGD